MTVYEGAVSIFEKGNTVEIRPVSSGGYIAKEISDLIKDLIETKKPISQWSLWIDDTKNTAPITAAAFAKLVKSHDISLIKVRAKTKTGRTFAAPRIRMIDKKTPAKVTVSTGRIGR